MDLNDFGTQCNNGSGKEEWIPFREGVAHPSPDHAEKAEQRQMIRVDPARHPAGEIDEDFLFKRRQQAFLLARRWSK